MRHIQAILPVINLVLIVSFTIMLTLATDASTLQAKVIQLEASIDVLTEELSLVRNSRVRKVTITAYSPREGECDEDPFITASMEPVRHGGIAVSRDLFNQGWTFGKRVYIPGYGVYRINDLMNVRWSERIDMFFFSTEEAKAFGNKEITAHLMED